MTSSPRLPDVTEVEPCGANDEACLAEIRQVLAKHGALKRFGLTLLHSHFPITDDEVLVETCDIQNRTLTIKPVKAAEVDEGESIETAWDAASGSRTLACRVRCLKHDRGKEHLPD